MSGHTVEEVKKETRVYLTVFVVLAALTAVTVGVSYLHLSTGMAIAVALMIASVKGFLVAGYFMHLLSEKKLIYSVLVITALFFLFLMVIPFGAEHDSIGG